MMMLVRQVIQDATGLSRRKCFSLFRDGQVQVDGVICEDFKASCGAGSTVSRMHDGKSQRTTVTDEPSLIDGTIIFHKPIGYVVARRDRYAPTIYELLPSEIHRHFRYAGRLDKETSGLLLLSSDGELIHQLTHPSYHVPKIYRVGLHKSFSPEDAERALVGERVGMFDPDDVRTDMLSFASVDGIGGRQITVTLTEGKKRHIRRLCRHLGYRVQSLERVSLGGLTLKSLASGEYRYLSEEEIVLLRRAIADATQNS